MDLESEMDSAEIDLAELLVEGGVVILRIQASFFRANFLDFTNFIILADTV